MHTQIRPNSPSIQCQLLCATPGANHGGLAPRRIVQSFASGSNNKDPFFDRDLENFQRLHNEGAISVGIIVTRGQSLQKRMVQIVAACAINHGVGGFDDLEQFDVTPTARQRRMVRAEGDGFVEDWARRFVQDKFGSATTHWDKLQERIERGVGNPCPLLLVGLPADSIYQDRLQSRLQNSERFGAVRDLHG